MGEKPSLIITTVFCFIVFKTTLRIPSFSNSNSSPLRPGLLQVEAPERVPGPLVAHAELVADILKRQWAVGNSWGGGSGGGSGGGRGDLKIGEIGYDVGFPKQQGLRYVTCFFLKCMLCMSLLLFHCSSFMVTLLFTCGICSAFP